MENAQPMNLDHIGIKTNYIVETVYYYKRLGFSEIGRFVNPETDSPVVFLALGSLVLEIFSDPESENSDCAVDHIALKVDDIEDAYRNAIDSGKGLCRPQIGFLPFWENGVRFFNLKGINGETVELIERLQET